MPSECPASNAQHLSDYKIVWQHLDQDAKDYLLEQSFSKPEETVESLQQFKQSRSVVSLSSSAREKLDILLPQLLHTVSGFEQPDQVLIQLLGWLESIVTRTSYLLLLVKTPGIAPSG